ncbi:MAG: carbamoyltransferase HypF, partial [Anaerolineales bacterium]
MDRLAERAITTNVRLKDPGEDLHARHVHIDGIVQGVGFRPFVYGLALDHEITGWVRNTSAGVDIEAEGTASSLAMFLEALENQPPALARIDHIQTTPSDPSGYTQFTILPSESFPGGFQPVSPDVSLCPDCRDELWDPEDRRHRYPFINCTNCGPRFTIIRDLPYDRPKTTMAGFDLCPECRSEYENPLDRRFHAQPVACPTCGPQLWLETAGGRIEGTNHALEEARRMLAAGKILAIKGLGGFQLACDAANQSTVELLRNHKGRPEKPLAVMVYDMEAAEALCQLTEAARALLASRERPIVLLPVIGSEALAPNVAPGQSTLGLMLPNTPLHELLLEPSDGFPRALIMTSGNLSGAPIIHTNAGARSDLNLWADGLLLHDRPIESRCDDSVARTFQSSLYPIRRARGYAPDPIQFPISDKCVLAVGAELKNTFCLTKEKRALLSPHIGDLMNFDTLEFYREGIQHFEQLFQAEPEAIAYDLHPDYLSTQYALERARQDSLPAFPIQHHHAHIAACLAEHERSFTEPAIGFAFDGTGFGPDGAIWGGEALLTSDGDFERAYRLRYLPMAGGEKAIREPWRLALAWLDQAGVDWDET